MPRRITVVGVPEEAIKELLDVTTAACSNCQGPAKVPEDVVAVMQHNSDPPVAFIICEVCFPEWEALFKS